MKKINLLAIALGSAIAISCVTNPMTGRKSFQFSDNSELSAMALKEYNATLSKAKVITNTAAAKSVTNVGLRIKTAAEKYYTSIGRASDLSGYQWQFALLEDKQINAWCMPGGKVAVYSGIIPITKDDNGLAVVMGHEISHALAGHGNERISQATIAQYGGSLLGASISNSQLQSIFQQAYPLGAQVTLLAYGRKQESEADIMGLNLMAMAGYDPRQAIPFWNRMEAASSGAAKQPEFLSTHPGPENRIAALSANMDKAMQYYKAAGGK
jgi:predicted Zn-dependent protease